MMNYGSIARYYRIALGFRQQDISSIIDDQKAPHSRSAYTCRESGTTRFSYDELIALATVFGISPRTFCYPELCSTQTAGKRTHRSSKENPRKISDLTPKEREIVAQYRQAGIARE